MTEAGKQAPALNPQEVEKLVIAMRNKSSLDPLPPNGDRSYFTDQYQNVPIPSDDQIDAVVKVKKGKLTHLMRLRLARWHLKCAFSHLWRIVRG